jgi:hypothetical protein
MPVLAKGSRIADEKGLGKKGADMRGEAVQRRIDDAADPEAVLSHVLSILAKQVKTMTDRRLTLEDHGGGAGGAGT